LPPIRASAPLVAKALELLRLGVSTTAFEELSLQVAAQTVVLENGHRNRLRTTDPSSVSRVTRVVRTIEHDCQAPSNLTELARLAHLSRYHFLRVFEEITGTTPHQYLLRVRLRKAAIRLRTEREKILEISLNCGFGDLSNFNHAFRAEFGLSPRQYRYHSSEDLSVGRL
jgi:transcriptional regulator GlxA family with amidase domain